MQDLEEDVLKASGRKPSLLPVEQVAEILRERRIPVNMDFIYGLPRQSPASFARTMERALAMRPERIVTFSYAHVPWVNPRQKILEKKGLPTTQEKSEMYRAAARQLSSAGYEAVGLDHFVLPADELYEAARSGTLHRNFQGYCTRRTTGQVYAFGTTGISQLASSYIQNTKEPDTYIRTVNRGEFPVYKGYVLSREEKITREVITGLMCNYRISWQEIADRFHITAEEVRKNIRYDVKALDDLAADGLIAYDSEGLRILPGARPFARSVSAAFDKLLLSESGKRFSRAL